MRDNYEMKDEYTEEIPKLLDSDSASATDTFNPLFQKIINNVHSVKQNSIKLEGGIEQQKETHKTDFENCMSEVNKLNNRLEKIYGDFEKHTGRTSVTDKNGVHGLRYFKNKMQINDNGIWRNFYDDIFMEDIIRLRAYSSDKSVYLLWYDPPEINYKVPSSIEWAGTKVVMNEDYYPKDETDGILICDSKIHNQYYSDGLKVNGLTNGKKYYFTLFPYSKNGVVSNTGNLNNKISVVPKKSEVITFSVKFTKYGTSVKYINEYSNRSFTFTDSDMEDFFGYYPCLVKNGQENGVLNKNDFSKFIDGRSADITSGDMGDVMICFPKRFVSVKHICTKNGIYTYNDVDFIEISISDEKLNDNYYSSFVKFDDKTYNKVYIGAYLTSGDSISTQYNTAIHSLKGKTPACNIPLNRFRVLARNKFNNKGDVFSYFQLGYLQLLYLLRFKDLNSQQSLGMGAVNCNQLQTTGDITYNKGMTYGSDSRIKLFGLEDLWGNAWEFVNGFASSYYENKYHFRQHSIPSYSYRYYENYLSKYSGFTTYFYFYYLFLPYSQLDGSSSELTGDYFYLEQNEKGNYCRFGGTYNSGAKAGLFNYDFSGTEEFYDTTTSSRMIYFSD